MRKGKIAKNTVLSPRHLDKLIEEATVDCYNEEEQATGFLTMIEENLALPFATRVLGVEASVVAVCERDGERQLISLTNLPLPSPPPSGAEWIAAYRRWACGRGDGEEEE